MGTVAEEISFSSRSFLVATPAVNRIESLVARVPELLAALDLAFLCRRLAPAMLT